MPQNTSTQGKTARSQSVLETPHVPPDSRVSPPPASETLGNPFVEDSLDGVHSQPDDLPGAPSVMSVSTEVIPVTATGET
ncbi:MAG: hypothetical protein VKK04_10115, partial [Synechococcales bacterium]|nr:hypothetical protein [Synechococcales bacterium]